MCNIQNILIKLCNYCNSNLGIVFRNQDVPLNTPEALEHWNRRAGIVFEESARRLSLAYASLPPVASQKSGFSLPAEILITFVDYTRPLSPLLEIFKSLKWNSTYEQARFDIMINGTLPFGKKEFKLYFFAILQQIFHTTLVAQFVVSCHTTHSRLLSARELKWMADSMGVDG